ncbi:hypothetical protein U2F26_09275 [Micromonospora sp. 4G57]|jgi:hypothetical protein|uniref:Uncharacterized protein n=2 Tax=Micromonospora sicca TaxID=2202420 RepID=A0ABU5J707_9ACTN|nr:hypothetical protein [Micromonospora sp. 4G57]MDZ5442924.1 hypothetical protein [Micromonospora sp. 4G57]MDZ5488365.1 hypothetical protein [Micromonospora sp. 4G53]
MGRYAVATMISEKVSVVKDKNYDLIHTIQLSLEHVWRMETYIADAEERGDSELATWFRKMQENNRKAADQGKKMLMERMQKENG